MSYLERKISEISNASNNIENYLKLINSNIIIPDDKILKSDIELKDTVYYLMQLPIYEECIRASKKLLLNTNYRKIVEGFPEILSYDKMCYEYIDKITEYFSNFTDINKLVECLKENNISHFIEISKLSSIESKVNLYIKVDSLAIVLSFFSKPIDLSEDLSKDETKTIKVLPIVNYKYTIRYINGISSNYNDILEEVFKATKYNNAELHIFSGHSL